MKKNFKLLIMATLVATCSLSSIAFASTNISDNNDNNTVITKYSDINTIANSNPSVRSVIGVTNREVALRSEANSSESNILLTIPKGKEITILDNNIAGNFYQIKYLGNTGYAYKYYIDIK